MDVLARGRRVLLTALAVAAGVTLASCRRDAMGPVGTSAYRSVPPSTRSGDAGARAPSPVAADFRQHMTRVSERAPLSGHGATVDGPVWANDAARDAWAAGTPMPEGAVLVDEAPRQGDRDAGLLFMEKQASGWRFVAIGAHGDLAEGARVAACARCHADAPADGVFRWESQAPGDAGLR